MVEIGSDSVAVPLAQDEIRPGSRLDVGAMSDVDTISNCSRKSDKKSEKADKKNDKKKEKENKKDKQKNKKQKEKDSGSKKKEKQKAVVTSTQPRQTRRRKCANCCKQFVAFLFSTVGLTCLMCGYAILGGFLFMQIEGPNEIQIKSNVSSSKMYHIELLWNLTVELNIFYQPNWTDMAEQLLDNYTKHIYLATKIDGWDGKDGPQELQWTFAGSLLYSITVITTIGKLHALCLLS